MNWSARIVPLVIARASFSHAHERAYFGDAQTRRSRERERGETDEQKRGRPQVYAIARASGCVHARATDVSKAADAVFVMLMFSLLTAQQRAAPLCAPRRCTGRRMGMQFVPQFLPASVTRNTRPSFSRADLAPPRSTSRVSSESSTKDRTLLAPLGWPVRSAFGNHRAAEIEPSRVHARRSARSVRARSFAADVTHRAPRGTLRSRETRSRGKAS